MVQLEQVLQTMPGVKKTRINDNTLQLTCEGSVHPVQVNEFCISKGITLSHLLLRKKSLETKFMELTN